MHPRISTPPSVSKLSPLGLKYNLRKGGTVPQNSAFYYYYYDSVWNFQLIQVSVQNLANVQLA